MFAVERSNPGLRITRHEKKMGLHGTTTVEFVLEDCIVPEYARLGPEDEGFYGAMFALERGRVAIAGVGVGLAQGAMEQAIGYAGELKAIRPSYRRVPRRPVHSGRHGHGDRGGAPAGPPRCTLALGDSDSFHLASAQAKCFATDVAMRVTTNAVQVFGGLGYMRGCPVERMMRDAKNFADFRRHQSNHACPDCTAADGQILRDQATIHVFADPGNWNGLGLVYSIVAFGFQIVARGSNIFNFAHGEFVALATLIYFSLSATFGLPPVTAVVLTILAVVLVSVAVERLMLAPVRVRDPLIVAILTVGIGTLMRGRHDPGVGPRRSICAAATGRAAAVVGERVDQPVRCRPRS